MSDQTWALEKMFKHRLQVDFSRGIIECRGYRDTWTWGFAEQKNFYEALQDAINDIERVS